MARSTLLLLIAFAVIALIAVALIVRAISPRSAAPPLIPTEPRDTTPLPPPAATDSDWIDPETRHWIDDVNKGDKPPN